MTNLKTKFLLGVSVISALAGLAANTAAAADCSITMTLKQGMKNSQVMCLQQMLNSKGYTVATSGVGSTGYESMTFGSKTALAVKGFQASKGLKADGIFGPMSRAALTSSTSTSTSTTTTTTTSTSTTATSGSISATVSTDNPAAGTVVQGQATADMLHITFTGTGTVNSVTLTRGGISNQSTLSNVYLYDGVNRLTDGYSFNTAGTLTMNNLNLMVNGSRTIAVKADVAAADYSISVSLTSFTAAGTTSATATNLKGNEMFIASGSTLASITLSGSNTVTGTPTVNAGTSSYAVWRQVFQTNTRTLKLKAANFRISGSAPVDATANAGLFIDGVKAGNNAVVTSMNGSSYLTFDMSAAPVDLTTGSHTFEVRVDIVKGASYNFVVSLQQASDIMVMDPQVGVNLAIGSFTASTGATVTIGSGTATITNDSTFNTVTNVTGGASNVVIAKFKIHGYGEDVKVTSLPVTPVLINACTSGSTYNSAPCNVTTAGTTHTQFASGNGLQNVTLYFNGSQIGTQQSWGAGALTFTLGSQMIIPAGVDSTLEVRADLRTSPSSTGAADATATSGANYTAGTVSANLGAGTAEGWSSHSSYNTPAMTGHTVAVQSGTLAVAVNSAYSSQSVTPNTASIKIGSFVLQNQSSSESVRVTGLTVNLMRNDGTTALNGNTDVSSCPTTATCYPALTNFGALKTSDSANPVQPQASNSFSVDFTIPAGMTHTVDVFADTGAATAGIFKATLGVTALGSTSNVSITPAAVVGQSITLSAGTINTTPTLVSASSTASQYIASANGITNGSQATYNLVSTGGSATVNELKFNVTSGTATSVTVGGVTAPVVSGVAWLQGLNLVVPNTGSGLNVAAQVSYPSVGASGLTSATTSQLSLTYVKYTSGGVVTTFTPAINANTMTLVGSKPVLTWNDSADQLVNAAQLKIGSLTVAADAAGDIKLNQIPLSVSTAGNVTFSSSAIVVKNHADNSSITLTGSPTLTVTANNTATQNVVITNGYSIAAGTSVTFDIYATPATVTGGPNANTVTTSLNGTSNFLWTDVAGSASGTATGTLIYNYPTNSSVIND